MTLIPVLQWLQEMPGVYIEFHINPTRHNEVCQRFSRCIYLINPLHLQLPLKRFYRYNLRPRLEFDESG